MKWPGVRSPSPLRGALHRLPLVGTLRDRRGAGTGVHSPRARTLDPDPGGRRAPGRAAARASPGLRLPAQPLDLADAGPGNHRSAGGSHPFLDRAPLAAAAWLPLAPCAPSCTSCSRSRAVLRRWLRCSGKASTYLGPPWHRSRRCPRETGPHIRGPSRRRESGRASSPRSRLRSLTHCHHGRPPRAAPCSGAAPEDLILVVVP